MQSLAGKLQVQEILRINVRWFVPELLRNNTNNYLSLQELTFSLGIACQGNYTTIPRRARKQVKKWAKRIPPPVSFGVSEGSLL